MEFTMVVVLVLVFALGWCVGGVYVYDQEIKILNGFRRRIEYIEAKYHADLENLETKGGEEL